MPRYNNSANFILFQNTKQDNNLKFKAEIYTIAGNNFNKGYIGETSRYVNKKLYEH